MTGHGCYAPTAMPQDDPAHRSFITGDPWRAFGYLVAGVAFYGLLGALADYWLGTSFMVAVGILLGAALGVYATWSRFRLGPDSTPARASKNVSTQELQ